MSTFGADERIAVRVSQGRCTFRAGREVAHRLKSVRAENRDAILASRSG
jgi:hypothetical protein